MSFISSTAPLWLGVLALALLSLAPSPLTHEEVKRRWALPESRWIEHSELDLHVHVVEYAPPPSVPVRTNAILVHGTSSSLHTFEPLYRTLPAEGIRVIAFDVPGFGMTVVEGSKFNYTVEAIVEVVQFVAEKHGVEEYHLVGHSLGGSFAWHYAVAESRVVRSLVMLASAGRGLRKLPLGFWLASLRPFQWMGEHLWLPRAFIRNEKLRTVANAASVDEETIDLYHALANRRGNTRGLFSWLNAAAPHMKTGSPWLPKFAQLRMPVFLVHGEKDLLVPAEHSRQFAKELPHAKTLFLEDVGHMPHLECDEVPVAVRDFILEAEEKQQGKT